jgi:hypothetical protein
MTLKQFFTLPNVLNGIFASKTTAFPGMIFPFGPCMITVNLSVVGSGPMLMPG